MVVKNIIEALKTEESVFITEVGLFKKVFVSSHIENGKIVPPENKIIFENAKEGNSFAFILFLSKKENIRIVDADIEIKKWIEDFKAVLESDRKVAFDNFGIFTETNDKAISFESYWIKELNLEYEGMEPILPETAPVEEKTITEEKIRIEEELKIEPEKEIEPPVIKEPVVNKSEKSDLLEIPENEIPIFPELQPKMPKAQKTRPETEEISSKRARRKRKSDIVLFIMVILCTIGFLVYLFKDPLIRKYHEIKETHPKSETLPESAVEEDLPNDTILDENPEAEIDQTNISVDPKPAPIPQPEPIVIPLAPKPKPEVKVKETAPAPAPTPSFAREEFVPGSYYVIGGSFGRLDNAERKAAELQKKGFNVKIMEQPASKMVRVTVGKYASEDEANAEAAKYPGFWVLK